MLNFKEFKKISSAEWKLKIQADLKGKDYQSLITRTPEEIDIKPFYHYDDYKKFDFLSPNSFYVTQELKIADEKIANKIARKSLKNGAENFKFIANKSFDFNQLTHNIDANHLIFKLNFLDINFFKKLYEFTQGKATILVNPIGQLIQTGNWYQNKEKDFQKLMEIKSFVKPDFHFLEIDTYHLLNAGATATQQIAYALSQAVDYIEILGSSVGNQLFFNFGIGNQYFTEISKLKVFRKLWQIIESEYKIKTNYQIYVKPGLRNKSLLDAHTNMLRTTMESMSGILGGANYISNLPFDYFFKKSNEFSERIARNQLIILKQEANFKQALKSTNGSYFLENLSNDLAEKSLKIFKTIEKGGGFLEQLYQGKIQEKIKAKAEEELKKFKEKKIVLIGVNKYFNDHFEMPQTEIYPFLKKRKGKTLIQPVITQRLAENIEMELMNKTKK